MQQLVQPRLVTDLEPVRPVPLDEVQRELLRPRTGAQLALGAAGSGTSSLLVEALAERLSAGEPAAGLLGLAPDQGSARRWREALVARAATAPPTITTAHGLALRLVQAAAAARRVDPPRLLSGNDQLDIIGDLVRGGSFPWPSMFEAALGTRGFAERVRDLIVRAAAAGWSPTQLGAGAGPEVWTAVAQVWREYQRVLALAGAIDYVDLLRRATEIAAEGRPRHLTLIAVEGYLELGIPQLWLLQAIRPAGSRLLATGDPDLVVDRFRGAAPDAAADFAERFADAAPVAVLSGCHRFGAGLESLRARLAAPLPTAGLPGAVTRALHEPRQVADGVPQTEVELLAYPDQFAEAAGIAALIHHFAAAAAGPGEPPRWRDAAVIVRTGSQLSIVEQALIGAGVPVAGNAADLRLADAPIVAQLLTGLRLAGAMAGLSEPWPTPAALHSLLVSGIAGCDPHELRRVRLRLRRDEVATASGEGRMPRGSHDLLLSELQQPTALLRLRGTRYPAVRPLLGLSRRIVAAAERIRTAADVDAVLWGLWSDEPHGPGGWATQLRRTALSGGPAAAAADRDLDAVLALFAQARRSVARGGSFPVADFLAAAPGMPFPGDRLAGTAPRSNVVSLLTANKAKGRQWPLVVVGGVQEGSWPTDLSGSGLLGTELIADPAATTPGLRSAHVADELRLFLLAITRATHRLVITCAAADDRDPTGPQPSRFVADTGLPLRREPAQPSRGGELGVVVALRAGMQDPALRTAALERLAQLRDDPYFRLADPAMWWTANAPSHGPRQLVPDDRPVELSVTGLTELAACPRRWYLTRLLHAGRAAPLAAGVGRLVHRVQEAWANGEIPADMAAAEGIVDGVWPALPLESEWHSRRRRQEVHESLGRLLVWHGANDGRISFAERSFRIDLELSDGDRVRLTGKADVGIDAGSGELAILDVKTAKSPPSRAQVERHVQLAAYQAAVAGGALQPASTPAGAGLLLVSVAEGAAGAGPKVLWQPPLEAHDAVAGGWFAEVLADAAACVRNERFPARESAGCRTCPVRPLCPAKSPDQGVGV